MQGVAILCRELRPGDLILNTPGPNLIVEAVDIKFPLEGEPELKVTFSGWRVSPFTRKLAWNGSMRVIYRAPKS